MTPIILPLGLTSIKNVIREDNQTAELRGSVAKLSFVVCKS